MRMPRPSFAVALVVLVGLAGCDPKQDVPAKAEPSHSVVYTVTTKGAAASDLKISYSDRGGAAHADTVIRSQLDAPYHYSQTVQTDVGIKSVSLSASASPGKDFGVTCTIAVDGAAQSKAGGGQCDITVDLTAVHAGPASAPASAVAGGAPAGCRFVTEAEAQTILQDASPLASVDVVELTGDATSCRYSFHSGPNPRRMKALGWVGVSVEPGPKDMTKFSAMDWPNDITVYRSGSIDYYIAVRSSVLHVTVPDVDKSTVINWIEPQPAVIGIYRAAKPRMP